MASASNNRQTTAGAANGGGAGATERLAAEIATIDNELREIEMLIAQARVEAERHETKRVQTADRLGQSSNLPFDDVAALNAQLVTLTRRAAVMEAQVEVLEGKRKILTRFRDSLAGFAGPDLDEAAAAAAAAAGGDAAGPDGAEAGGDGQTGPSRIVLNAQEDLRREIARAMHDGPAQSLTNIVLQAQIVERLMTKDPDGARGEVRLLISMVQQTLDATKSFIFDVRPMVLDDLGLVPTLRRSARERGRRASVPVEFDTAGQDRRLPVEIESSLFRILDEAMAAYLAASPDRVVLRLDWSDERVAAQVSASRAPTAAMSDADRVVEDAHKAAAEGKDLPPALESMMADRVGQAEAAANAARSAAIVALPASVWREIQQRATSTGIAVQLVGGGGELRVIADLGESRTAPDEHVIEAAPPA